MFTLRQKLLIGYGGLMLALAIVSALSILMNHRYHATLEDMFLKNYGSVRACRAARLEVAHLVMLASASIPNDRPRPDQALLHDRDFRTHLARQQQLASLSREAEITSSAIEQYEAFWNHLADFWQLPTAQRQPFFSSQILMQGRGIRGSLDEIEEMNLNEMERISHQTENLSWWSRNATILLLITGAALGGLFLLATGRWVVRPLALLTRSAQQMQRGEIQQVTVANPRDEIGQLAHAFNAMAVALQKFRKVDQAKLLRTQETTRAAINALPHAVAIFSPDGQIELANRLAETLFGLRPGMRVQEAGPHARLISALVEQASATRQRVDPKGYESAIQVFEEGRELFFLPHALPILDSAGTLIGTLIVLADATELRQIDEAKSGLLATVSHELKTPLTSIQMAIHLLIEDAKPRLTPQQFELLETARSDADRLHRIIEQLLDMGRLQAGRAELQRESVRPAGLVQQALESLARDFQSQNIQVCLDVPESLPSVHIDPLRAAHILVNLLSNALKYTPSGGRVTVAAAAAGGFVEFSVADSGPGVPEEFRQQVFDRFFRAPAPAHADAPAPPGVGLGLSIAREIVQAHGGTIGVRPNTPTGSVFYFTLACTASA